MDNEIDVQELIILSGSQLRSTDRDIPVCHVGQMQPIYQQGPNGMVYSCAMSSVNMQQGFVYGIPYVSNSYNYPGCTNILNPELIRGCCGTPNIDLNNVIIVPPNFQKG